MTSSECCPIAKVLVALFALFLSMGFSGSASAVETCVTITKNTRNGEKFHGVYCKTPTCSCTVKECSYTNKTFKRYKSAKCAPTSVNLPKPPPPPSQCKAIAKDINLNVVWNGKKCTGPNGCLCTAYDCNGKISDVKCQNAP